MNATLTAIAEDRLFDTSVFLQKPRQQPPRQGGPLDKVELRLWLPDGVGVVRGAIVNPFHTAAVEQKHWQEAARLWRFAVIGANYADVSTAEYATLEEALRIFAKQSGRAEIEFLPLCFVGMSAGGGMSMQFADAMPERTIAVAPVCLEVGPRSAATRAIPAITVFGEKDGKQMELLLQKLPLERSADARWAIGVQWGRRHEFGAANNLILPFFDEVIRQRYPANTTPEKGPVTLLESSLSMGWIGDPASWEAAMPTIEPYAEYQGERSRTCWLPSQAVACVWRAFVAKSPTVSIDRPASLGDGQPFTTHSAGELLTVTVKVRGEGIARVELFDKDQRLSETNSLPPRFQVENLEPGIHSLIAIAHNRQGVVSISRPSTIIVVPPSSTR